MGRTDWLTDGQGGDYMLPQNFSGSIKIFFSVKKGLSENKGCPKSMFCASKIQLFRWKIGGVRKHMVIMIIYKKCFTWFRNINKPIISNIIRLSFMKDCLSWYISWYISPINTHMYTGHLSEHFIRTHMNTRMVCGVEFWD